MERITQSLLRRIDANGNVLLPIAIILLVSWTASAQADGVGFAHLLGIWQGGDHASESVYGKLVISNNRISWKSPVPGSACSVKYQLVSREVAATFPGEAEWRKARTGNSTFTTFRLELEKKDCTDGVRILQFSFWSELKDTNYVDFVAFNDAGKYVELGTFYRVPGST